MNIRDQIAAARALADAATPAHEIFKWTKEDGAFVGKSRQLVSSLCDRLERACELLEDAADNSLYPGKRAVVRAFLAGECSKCDGTGEIRCDRDDIAAALRKAAADEREVAREHAAQIAETHVGYHVNGVAHSIAAAIRRDGCDGCLACRARAKGGA